MLPGYEMLPSSNGYIPDTANIRPENFSFRIWDKKDLADRLAIDVDLPPESCKPSWGLFIFRVNGLGQVDSTRYEGNLAPITSSKILANICATEGNWMVKRGTKPNQVAWFAYPFFDIRGRYSKQLVCSSSDRELLKAVSSLSNMFWLVYYKVRREEQKGTLIRPTTMDGIPRI